MICEKEGCEKEAQEGKNLCDEHQEELVEEKKE